MWAFPGLTQAWRWDKEVRAAEYSLQNFGRNCKSLSKLQDHPAKVLSALIPLETSSIIPGPPVTNPHTMVVGWDGGSQRRAHSFYTVSTASERMYAYVCTRIAYKSYNPGWHTTGYSPYGCTTPPQALTCVKQTKGPDTSQQRESHSQ